MSSSQLLATRARLSFRKDKSGIADDAVSAVTAKATIYMPFAELVDLDKGDRASDQGRGEAEKELARSEGHVK